MAIVTLTDADKIDLLAYMLRAVLDAENNTLLDNGAILSEFIRDDIIETLDRCGVDWRDFEIEDDDEP